jgi:hypothetical protein
VEAAAGVAAEVAAAGSEDSAVEADSAAADHEAGDGEPADHERAMVSPPIPVNMGAHRPSPARS